MSLPEDPKERVKIFVLIGIMSITVVAVVVMFVVKPHLARKAVMRAERILIEDELDSMRKVVARMNQGRTLNNETLQELVELSEHGEHILLPRFGRNYLLVAQDIVQREAEKAGVEVTVAERSFSTVPRDTKSLNTSMIKYYTLHVEIVNGGLREAVALTRALESLSPYLNISNVSVTALTGQSGHHNISLLVQWPVWADEDTLQSLKQQLDEIGNLSGIDNHPTKLKTSK